MLTPLRSIGLLALLLLIRTESLAQLGAEHRFLYPVRTYALALSDLDADGDGDVLQAEGDHLFVHTQLAPNEFLVTQDLGATGRVDRLLLVDLDADGMVDLVMPRRDADAISWMQGMGTGVFAPLADLIIGIDAPFDVQAKDMDGDLDLDLVFAYDTLSVTVAWAPNDGPGTFFAQELVLNTGTAPYAPERVSCFAIGDVDGDATADVIVNGTDLMWYDNDGAGEFTATNLGASPASDILLADTDNDTDPDLVFAQDPDVNVRLNNGSGSFGTSSQLIAPISSTNRVRGLHAKDIEGDGDMDVVYWLGGLVSDVDRLIHGINTGDAQFTMVGHVEAEAIFADDPFPFAIGDADGNPLNDVVAVANDGIYLRSDVVQARHLLTSVATPASLSVADLDGNTGADVIISALRTWSPLSEGFPPLQVAWHENNGLGALLESPHEVIRTRSPVRRTVPADLDGDGDQDLAVVSRDQDAFTGITISWYSNTNGVFGYEADLLDLIFPALDSYILMPEVRDVDLDGDLDVLYYNNDGYDLMRNNGDGTFQPSATTTLGGGFHIPFGAALCDVDADGDPDYVWSHGEFPTTMEHDSLFLNLNSGDGLPGPPQFIGTTPVSLMYPDLNSAIRRGVDIDAEGGEDLISFGQDTIAVQLSTGVAFTVGQVLVAPGMVAYDVGDLNDDDTPDITAICMNGDLRFWAQLSDHTFNGPYTLITGAQHSGRTDLRLADMDGDEDLDIVTCANTGAAAWLENSGGVPLSTAELLSSSTSSAFTVFPNPVSDQVFVTFHRPLQGKSEIEIFDTRGRHVLFDQTSGTSAMIALSGLSSGLYLLRISDAGSALGTTRIMVK